MKEWRRRIFKRIIKDNNSKMVSLPTAEYRKNDVAELYTLSSTLEFLTSHIPNMLKVKRDFSIIVTEGEMIVYNLKPAKQ